MHCVKKVGKSRYGVSSYEHKLKNMKYILTITAAFIVLLVLFLAFASERTQTQTDVSSPIEPTPAPMTGKLDPKVVCESALMYTTFTDGAAADAFVADCVAGKHPEVFERYISDLNLNGATI